MSTVSTARQAIERPEFETWYRQNFGSTFPITRGPSGAYVNAHTRIMFEQWMAIADRFHAQLATQDESTVTTQNTSAPITHARV